MNVRPLAGPTPARSGRRGTYVWESTAEGGTRMILRNRGEPAGSSRLGAPFLAAAMRRANRKDLSLLRSILERQA